ncbi:MAG TPA: tandem-95 repeat protein [Pirellulaceae bacterium]
MSNPRRSIIRSSLQRIRQLWHRRETARQETRKDMRRCLGSTFELLEPRMVMTISAPLPPIFDSNNLNNGAHIHPVLTLIQNGHQIVIPAGVGMNGSSFANPHTHDYSGTLHIGESATVGTDSAGSGARNTTLNDFFNVWSSSTLTSGAALNSSAKFDTNPADGAANFMGLTVDANHVLRMYVQEGNGVDSAPELEYDSSSSSNDLTRPELYVPRDGDQIIVDYELKTQAAFAPSFDTISSQNVLGGAPSWLGINGIDPNGGPLTYTVSVANPALLTATIPTGNKSLVLNTSSSALEGGFGQMTFQLFDNLAPNTTQHIETLVNDGEFASSSSNSTFYRIAYSGTTPFVIQGGPSNSTSSLGKMDDEFNTDLQFTSTGLLAMAKSTDDTGDDQVFVTAGPTRFLDFQHSIFGVLTQGDAVRQAIQNSRTSGDGAPPNTISITGAQIITDTQNAALELKAAEGASGSTTVTLTVQDQQGHTYAQTFNVTVTPDTANSAPFLNPITPPVGNSGQPINIQLTAQDAENIAADPNFFDANKPANETTNYTLNVNNSTGLVTVTPPAGFVGTFHVTVGVRGTQTTTTADAFDTQDVLVTVNAGGPTSVDLATISDSGSSNSDNITNASSLDFAINGVTAGATVKLLKGTTVLAQGVASSNTITLTVANPGTALGQGASDITATQTVSGTTSSASPALHVVYDTSVPTFSSTAPTTALVGFDLNYNAQANEEGGTSGLTYTLTNAPTGASINSTTGVVTFSPTSTANQSFNVVATDAAGNTASQAVNLTVDTAQVDLTFTITKPDGSAITTLSVGQDFVLHVFAQDVRSGAQGVFAAYLDVNYDSTKATVTGPLTYSSTYSNEQTGTTTTAGLIDEGGAFAGNTSPLGPTKREVFSVPLRASASGTLTFSGDPADGLPDHNVLVYGQDTAVPAAQIHYSSTSVEVGPTFNAVNDTFAVNQDSSNNSINPLANDANVGSATNTLTISAVGTTDHGGIVTISSDGKTLNYSPAAAFSGTETFTYTAKNQSNETHTATISMNVSTVNHAPTATNDSFNVSKNSNATSLDVLANDTITPDTGETLRVSAVGTGSQGGSISIASDGKSVLYTPKANFTGTETFTYTINDRAAGVSGGLTSQGTVTVTTGGLAANNDTFSVSTNASATTIDVLANDTLDSTTTGGTLTVTAVGTTDHGGTVSITQNNTRLSYTPASNFKGTEKFTYTISDGLGHTATGTVTMNVNGPPTGATDTLTAFKDTATTLDVLTNDTSGTTPAGTLTIDSASLTQPAHGTVAVSTDGTKITYTPTAGYTGADSFTYKAKGSDGQLSAATTANITVQDFQPSTLSGFVYFDVNNNGIKDVGELPIVGITITLTGTATAGTNTTVNQTVKTLEDGSYKFETLAPGAYQIKETQPQFVIDGKGTAGSQGGTVTTNQIAITNMAQNTTGANNNFGELGRQLTTISIRDFFSSTSRNYARAAFDTSGNELWHTVSGSDWTGTTNAFTLQSSQSQIKFDSTNSQSQTTSTTFATNLPVYLSGQASGSSLYYIPHSAMGTSGGNTGAPVGVADSYSTAISTALTIPAASGVLKNDTAAAGKTLTASVVTQPGHGTLTLNADGSFTYTPTTGFTGTDTFTYKSSDGTKQSAATTVTISVGSGPPTAVADAFSATEDTALAITAANGVLHNDVDPTNHALTATIVTQPTKGTITLAADGSFTYTPNANANGTDTFTYKANNGTSDSNIATATITIAAVNDTPVAGNDSFTTTKDTVLTVSGSPNLLSNDTDADGNTLTVSTTPVQAPTNGTLVLSANGNFTYTPNAAFTGSDTFTYQISDGTATATGTVTITVNAANHAPIATADSYNFDEDVGGTISAASGVLANDTDSDANTTLRAINATQPAHGTVVLNPDGSFTYTPVANFFGSDPFTYQASDGSAQSTTTTVSITVHAVNDSPVGNPDSYRVTPNTPLNVPAANGVLKNDSDVDSPNLTATVLVSTVNGTLNFHADGSFTYAPNSGFTGTDTFTYRVSDDSNPPGQSGSITVNLIVNTAPTAQNDSYSTNEDATLTVTANGVLANDSDINSDPLTAAVITPPTNGTLNFNSNGTFTYTPDADFVGTDTFRYQTSDGIIASSPATVTITINAVNDAPVRIAGDTTTVSADADSANTDAVGLGLDGLEYGPGGGDDEANQTLLITLGSIPTFVNLFEADGTTPVNSGEQLTLEQLQGLTYKTLPGIVGGGTITWTVRDDGGTANGGVDTLSENLTITVGVNDQPERITGTITPVTVDEDSTNTTAVTLDLSDLDYGPGGGATEAGQNLTIKLASFPSFIQIFQADGTTPVTAGATLSLDELQGLTFKTMANANGNGIITWTIQDDGGTADGGIDTLTESLAITVNAVNDSPVRISGAPASPSFSEDTANTTAVPVGLSGLTYGVGGGSDEASQTLSIQITGVPAFISLFKSDGTTAVTAGSTLTVAELQGLKLKTTADTSGTGNITWNVVDNGGTAHGGVDTLAQTLSVSINAVNDSPVLTAGALPSLSVSEDASNTTAVALGLSGVNYGPGGGNEEAAQTLTYKITAIPAMVALFKADGTTAVNANDTLTLAELQGLTYKTVANATGTGNITFTVKDNGGTTNSGTDTLTQSISVNISAVNDKPVRTAGTIPDFRVPADAANTTAVPLLLSNLTYGPGGGADEAGQTLTFKITNIPSFAPLFLADGTTPVTVNETLSLTQLQGLTYKTIAGQVGAGVYTWTVQDNGGTANGGVDTLTENQVITVGVNDPPARTAGNPVPINVNEDSANANAVSLGLTGVTYGPGGAGDESGQTLTYKVITIPAFINVFKADGTTAVDANTTLTLSELQGLTYKTIANANGAGTLAWTVQDSGGVANGGNDTLTETIAVAINAVNDVPARTAGTFSTVNVAEDSANSTAVTLGLSGLDYGPGGGSDEATQSLNYLVTSIPSTITLFKADGTTPVTTSTTLTLADLQGLKYETVANAVGTGNLVWSIKDSGGTANGGIDTLAETLSVVVNAVNDAPVLTSTAPTSITADEDSVATTPASLGLTGLAYGPGGGADESQETLTYEITSIPSFINVFKADGTTAVAANATLTLADLQGLKYTTVADANGAGHLTWTVKDDGGTTGGGVDTLDQSLSITINAINDAPQRTNGTANDITVSEDEFDATATPLGLDSLDYGPGGGADEASSQTLTYVIQSIPPLVNVFQSDGTTAVHSGDTLTLAELKALTYKTVPDANSSGDFSWIVKDDGGTANGGVDNLTESFTIHITPVNDAPHGVADAYDVAQDSTLTVTAANSVLNNDTDVEGDAKTAEKLSDPVNGGTVTFSSDGTFIYQPAAGFHGSDSFTYRPKDADPGNETTVIIVVHGIPVATDDAFTTDQDVELDTTAATGVQANDNSPDSRPLTVHIVNTTGHGLLTMSDDGSFTYTPQAGFAGDDSFSYTLTDGVATSNQATATIHVKAPGEPEATDLALLSLLGADGEAFNSLTDNGVNNYQDAVDQLMAQLGN